jgi:hypothetical protein
MQSSGQRPHVMGLVVAALVALAAAIIVTLSACSAGVQAPKEAPLPPTASPRQVVEAAFRYWSAGDGTGAVKFFWRPQRLGDAGQYCADWKDASLVRVRKATAASGEFSSDYSVLADIWRFRSQYGRRG